MYSKVMYLQFFCSKKKPVQSVFWSRNAKHCCCKAAMELGELSDENVVAMLLNSGDRRSSSNQDEGFRDNLASTLADVDAEIAAVRGSSARSGQTGRAAQGRATASRGRQSVAAAVVHLTSTASGRRNESAAALRRAWLPYSYSH